jgi:hypothetical protein
MFSWFGARIEMFTNEDKEFLEIFKLCVNKFW